ncbi:MAG: hypothetical protein ACHQD8_04330, partial [Chitinophagales bacterium]
YKFTFLCFCVLAGIYAYAGDNTDTLSSSDYQYQMPKHLDPLYNGPLRYIIFGVVVALILYVSYRYFEANRVGKDIFHEPR